MEQFFAEYGSLLAQGTLDTVVMTIASTFFAYVIGLPLGALLAKAATRQCFPPRFARIQGRK